MKKEIFCYCKFNVLWFYDKTILGKTGRELNGLPQRDARLE